MDESEIAIVDSAQMHRTMSTLVAAFADDPVERWLWPSTQEYEEYFPSLLGAMGRGAFDHRTVWRLGDYVAVALWFPPSASPDGDEIVDVLSKTVASDKHNDTFQVLEEMGANHPEYPHWYLPWFGVQPVEQGRGVGSQLMERCLERIDSDRLPAYLETPNPRNLSFYERHGFEVVGQAQSGTCPPMTFMLRPPMT
jgi:GNAT superfamily N-acetyltransferase